LKNVPRCRIVSGSATAPVSVSRFPWSASNRQGSTLIIAWTESSQCRHSTNPWLVGGWPRYSDGSIAAVVVGNPLSISWTMLARSLVMRFTNGRVGSKAFFHPHPSIRISTTFFATTDAPPRKSSGSRGRSVLPVNRYSNVPDSRRNDRTCDGGENLSLLVLGLAVSTGIYKRLSATRPTRQRPIRRLPPPRPPL
jgi:hypothetical protein